MELYGALKQVDPRSAADAHALHPLENTTVEKGTMSECYGLKTTSKLPDSVGSIKIFGKAAYVRPANKRKVIDYYQ